MAEHDKKAGPLATRIAAAMSEAEQVTKSSRNEQQKYNFASAETILAATRGPLLERGIVLLPSVVDVDEQEITANSGTRGSRVIVTVRFTFTDGVETIESDWRGEGQDYGDKAFGKAYTNAVKTYIRTAWLLPTEHDDPEASDPGQRAGKRQPVWQQQITKQKYDEAWGLLSATIGEERTGALVQAIGETWGYVPNGFASLSKAFLGHLQAELQPHGLDELVRAARDVENEDRETRDAENKAAEEEVLDAVASGDEAAVLEGLAKMGATEVSDDPAVAPAPGSIPDPKLPKDPAKAFGTLKAAGCTCPDPIGVRSDKPEYDSQCPIAGHHIPF